MIKQNVERLLRELPDGVLLEGAAKSRSAEEIDEAVKAGLAIIGENYVQEAEKVIPEIERDVRWHFIGHLQKNKVKKAVRIFDTIETIDSLELAEEIDKACLRLDKDMTVYIEINSGREKQKFGVFPEHAESLIRDVSKLKKLRIEGLMTIGPLSGASERARAYFRETKNIFDSIKELNVKNVSMKYLSMGMSGTYKVAIEEGANIVRLGAILFGKR